MEPAISIYNLSKKYKIQNTSPYIALRDVISNSFKNLFNEQKKKADILWALKNVNLEIFEGERIGIIGRNGAGKSTLLKIISRITPPSGGKIILNGKVASLLEVGTGFHRELTGRENIYLNGSILGLSKKEIDRSLDEIIDFSGVERFIDMPLKHYSSGMELRLAFSVAAFLEPDILLIDEVLAVGDLEFQKKCIGKMEEISNRKGRTILFVSHNMNYILSLCNKGILLDNGGIIKTGNISEVVGEYVTKMQNKSASYIWNIDGKGNDIVRLISLRVIDEGGNTKQSFSTGEKIGIEMKYKVLQDGHVLWLGHNIHNQEGINVFDTHSVGSPYYHNPHDRGEYISTAWIPNHLLNTGNYIISSAVFNHKKQVIHVHEKDILLFSVYDTLDTDSARGMSPGDFPGVVRPMLNWNINKI